MDLSHAEPHRVLITGITGTLGRAVCARLLNDCGQNIEIMGISRDEQKQRLMPVDPRLTLRLANVEDYESLKDAIELWQGPAFALIFHFAAYKCLDVLESQPLANIGMEFVLKPGARLISNPIPTRSS